MAPVERFAGSRAHSLHRFKATVIFQGFTAGLAETQEIGMLRMLAVAGVFVQRAQQALLALAAAGQSIRVRRSSACSSILQTKGVDGVAHFTFAEGCSRARHTSC